MFSKSFFRRSLSLLLCFSIVASSVGLIRISHNCMMATPKCEGCCSDEKPSNHPFSDLSKGINLIAKGCCSTSIHIVQNRFDGISNCNAINPLPIVSAIIFRQSFDVALINTRSAQNLCISSHFDPPEKSGRLLILKTGRLTI